MLRAVAYAADAAKAWPIILEVVQSFRKLQLSPDAPLWSLAMRKSPKKALALLQDFRDFRRPEPKSYSAALGAMSKTSEWQSCCDLMCEISQRLLRVNSVIGVSEQSWQAAIALQHWKNCGYELTAATAAGLEMKGSSATRGTRGTSSWSPWELQISCLEKLRRLGRCGL